MDRVLEIGGYAAGYCGRLFAQCGHSVLRVNDPAPPAWVDGAAMAMFLDAGKTPVDARADALAELADGVDVAVIEAEGADAVTALGFDNWRAPVKVAITPFGRTGPKKNCPATPHTLLAMGGYTYLTGDAHRAPLSLPGHYVEFQSGGFAFAAANACRLSGEHKTIDVSMLEVVMALSQFTTVAWHCAGVIRSRHGNDFWSVAPTNMFRCADGWVYVNIAPTFWDAFTIFLNQPELTVDERFVTNAARMRNRDALHGIIARALATETKTAIAERAEACRIPLGVALSFAEVLADPHLATRDMWQRVDGSGGQARSPRPPWRVHGEPWPTFA